ncbi:hypothetical protein JCM33374_g5250 [Metschnikowia sp. JCM 33374]|nr:hypothetical protein JCM33374_g5250 [Metschnikowia sp. JCM 33374]
MNVLSLSYKMETCRDGYPDFRNWKNHFDPSSRILGCLVQGALIFTAKRVRARQAINNTAPSQVSFFVDDINVFKKSLTSHHLLVKKILGSCILDHSVDDAIGNSDTLWSKGPPPSI